MSKVTIDRMESLFDIVVASLHKRIMSGEASAAELQVAVKLLKDNGIQAEADGEGGLRELLDGLPTFDNDDTDNDDPLLQGTR